MTKLLSSKPFWKLPENVQAVGMLKKQLQTPMGVVPFIGAGVSIPYGFPGWTEFLRVEAKNAGISDIIEGYIDREEYEEAADEIEHILGKFLFSNAIQEEYGRQPEITPFDLSVAQYLPFLTDGPVITTNFDRVLEIAFAQSNDQFKGVVWGAKSDLIRQAIGESGRFLLKVHGDAFDHEDRVLTLSEYVRHYGNQDVQQVFCVTPEFPLPFLLYRLMSGRHLMFIGCSMGNDRTMRVLKALARIPTPLEHYAILKHPGSQEKMSEERRRYGDEYRTFVIWIPVGSNGEGWEQLPQFFKELVRDRYPEGHNVRRLITAIDQKDWQLTQELAQKLPKKLPITREVYALSLLAKGKAEIKKDNINYGMTIIDEALEQYDQNPEIYFWKALIYIKKRDWKAAIKFLTYSINLKQNYQEAFTYRGIACYYKDGSGSDEAVKNLSRAIELNPEDYTSLFYRAAIYILRKDYPKAHQDLQALDNSGDPILTTLRDWLPYDKDESFWKPLIFDLGTEALMATIEELLVDSILKID